MCGLAGFIDFNRQGSAETLNAMTDSLSYRGPDDRGVWLGEVGSTHVGLGHRRLSIIDLSNAAAQPMVFGHLRVVFNGEIYNHAEVRVRLEGLGHSFHSESDTEVLLHAYAQWGVSCVDVLIGMFAFVIVDEANRVAHFFQDRAGVKPLYLYRRNGLVLFGSELKALHPHPGFTPEVNAQAFSRFFDFGYVPAGQAIFNETTRLAPGTRCSLDLTTGELETERYWAIDDFYHDDKLTLSYAQATNQLEELLHSACRYRMVADVPVGLFLSGGYDSTAVLASLSDAQNTSQRDPIEAFTIGFETGNNELPQATRIAETLGANHHAYVCTEADARAIIPQLPEIYDEPFADSSAIPTTLVSRFARQQVTVALSADGGDELFYGYTSYAHLGRRLARLKHVPVPMRKICAAGLRAAVSATPASLIRHRQMFDGLAVALDSSDKAMARKLHVVARCLPRDYQRALFRGFAQAEAEQSLLSPHADELLDEAAAWDYGHYLVGDILTKVDRATMSASLEGREPLLDHRIAEFAARLPEAYKLQGAIQKRVLREVVHRRVPADVMAGPKRGFSVPVLKWLREDLSHLVETHLSEEALNRSGSFQTRAVRQVVSDFMAGRLHYSPLIWKLLMYQMWHQRWMQPG